MSALLDQIAEISLPANSLGVERALLRTRGKGVAGFHFNVLGDGYEFYVCFLDEHPSVKQVRGAVEDCLRHFYLWQICEKQRSP